MTTSVSRRNFLAGAGIAALSAATLGATGCTPAEQDASQKNADSTKANSRWSWDIAPEAPAEDQISETIDCDVCILGAGSAGMPAALYASIQNLKTVVLQKYDKPQSNGWSFAAFNTRNDADKGITYDPVNVRTLMSEYASGRANVDLICSIIDKSGSALDWLDDQMSDVMPMSMISDAEAGFQSQAPHMVYFWMHGNDYAGRYGAFDDAMEVMAEKSEANGARFLYNTPAVQLIKEGDAVVGAYGQAADGSFVRVNAAKGVLIATGDVTDDEEMIEYFIPTNIGVKNMSPYGTCTGDGHKMAKWAGAKWDTPPLCLGMSTGSGHDNYDGNVPPAYSDPALRVNTNGLRFVNEAVCGTDKIYSGSPLQSADALQPGHISWSIYGSQLSERVTMEDLEPLLDLTVFSADTIEELAEKAGIDKDNLVASVARYNEIVAAEADTDYGVPAEFLKGREIIEGPFYALRREPLNMAAIGGIQADPSLHVINENHRPIEGLYVAGNAMGSCYGYQYPWQSFSASNKMHAMTGGILAIRSMMGILDEEF